MEQRTCPVCFPPSAANSKQWFLIFWACRRIHQVSFKGDCIEVIEIFGTVIDDKQPWDTNTGAACRKRLQRFYILQKAGPTCAGSLLSVIDGGCFYFLLCCLVFFVVRISSLIWVTTTTIPTTTTTIQSDAVLWDPRSKERTGNLWRYITPSLPPRDLLFLTALLLQTISKRAIKLTN